MTKKEGVYNVSVCTMKMMRTHMYLVFLLPAMPACLLIKISLQLYCTD